MHKSENPGTFRSDVIQEQELPPSYPGVRNEYGKLQTELDQVVVHSEERAKPSGKVWMKIWYTTQISLYSQIGSGIRWWWMDLTRLLSQFLSPSLWNIIWLALDFWRSEKLECFDIIKWLFWRWITWGDN